MSQGRINSQVPHLPTARSGIVAAESACRLSGFLRRVRNGQCSPVSQILAVTVSSATFAPGTACGKGSTPQGLQVRKSISGRSPGHVSASGSPRAARGRRSENPPARVRACRSLAVRGVCQSRRVAMFSARSAQKREIHRVATSCRVRGGYVHLAQAPHITTGQIIRSRASFTLSPVTATVYLLSSSAILWALVLR